MAVRDYKQCESAGSIVNGRPVVSKKRHSLLMSGEYRSGSGWTSRAREACDFFFTRGGGLEVWIKEARLDILPETVREGLLKGTGVKHETLYEDTMWSSQTGRLI